MSFFPKNLFSMRVLLPLSLGFATVTTEALKMKGPSPVSTPSFGSRRRHNNDLFLDDNSLGSSDPTSPNVMTPGFSPLGTLTLTTPKSSAKRFATKGSPYEGASEWHSAKSRDSPEQEGEQLEEQLEQFCCRPCKSRSPEKPSDCPVCLEPLNDSESAVCAPFGCRTHLLHEDCFRSAIKSLDDRLINLASLEAHTEAWNKLVSEGKTDPLQAFKVEVLPSLRPRNHNLLKCYECRAEMSRDSENFLMKPHRESVGFLAKKQALNEISVMERRQLATMGVRFGTGTVSLEQMDAEEGEEDLGAQGLWVRDEHEGLGAKGYRCGCDAEAVGALTGDLEEGLRWKLHGEASVKFLESLNHNVDLPEGWLERANPFLQCAGCGERRMQEDWKGVADAHEEILRALVSEEQREVRVQHRFWQLVKAEGEVRGRWEVVESARQWMEKIERFNTQIVHVGLDVAPIGTFESDGELLVEVGRWLEGGNSTDLNTSSDSSISSEEEMEDLFVPRQLNFDDAASDSDSSSPADLVSPVPIRPLRLLEDEFPLGASEPAPIRQLRLLRDE